MVIEGFFFMVIRLPLINLHWNLLVAPGDMRVKVASEVLSIDAQ
jgi:hypothetical protein